MLGSYHLEMEKVVCLAQVINVHCHWIPSIFSYKHVGITQNLTVELRLVAEEF